MVQLFILNVKICRKCVLLKFVVLTMLFTNYQMKIRNVVLFVLLPEIMLKVLPSLVTK